MSQMCAGGPAHLFQIARLGRHSAPDAALPRRRAKLLNILAQCSLPKTHFHWHVPPPFTDHDKISCIYILSLYAIDATRQHLVRLV